MLELKVTGLVARCVDYRESERILTLLTPDFGKVTASARGCRKVKSPLFACAQPFCYAEFVLHPMMGKWTVSQCDLREGFFDLRLHYDRLIGASELLRCALFAAPEEREAQELFVLTYYALSFFAYADNPPADLLLCYLLKLLRLLGYMPATTRCGVCGKSTFENARFDIDLGALCASCGAVRGGVRTEPLTLEAMRRMIALPPQDMKKVVLPVAVRSALAAFVPEYFAHHTGFLPELGALVQHDAQGSSSERGDGKQDNTQI